MAGTLNIKIIFYDPYPHGMALTNRINLYAKGIVEAGGSVQILIQRPTERNCENAHNTWTNGCVELFTLFILAEQPSAAELF